jgi:flagellar export protein FliJ
MAFRSSLDVLLRVRRGLERQQELVLQEANRQVAAREGQLHSIRIQIAANAQRELLQLQSGLSAAELHFDLLCRSALQARGHAVETELLKAQALQQSRARSWRLARQQREVLETLRQRQLQAYRQQATRQEQRRLDDLFLLRRAYLSRG